MICERCGMEYVWGGDVKINDENPVHVCGSCLFKIQTLLQKTDYEWIRDALTKTGYESDIESYDEDNYFVLSSYGNKVAVEFDECGEFARITEAE